MILFTAQIAHSNDTIKRFTRLQYDTFEIARKAVLLIISVVLIILGVSRLAAGDSLISVVLLIVGCLLITNLNIRADSVADNLISTMNGKFPVLNYSFADQSFTDGDGRPDIAYTKLYRIIEDDEYLYLFTSKASGYMCSSSSVRKTDSPVNAVDELKTMIAEKSGLSWTRPVSLFNVSIKDIRSFVKKLK